MTFIDFFAGVGGFRRGLELAGHKCLGFCEYDKFAVQSYRAIHDTEGEWYAKDIRTVRADDIPRADIWCAGFPCQDISVAGKCLGFKGKRSSLFFTVTGLVKSLEEENKPTYLFFENVKNRLSVNRGFDFAKICIKLDEIGYDAEWCVLNSSDVIPQNRERIFIIGRLRGGNGRQVLPIGDGNPKADKLHRAVPVVKQIGNYCPTKTRDNPNQGRVYDINEISPSLNCMGGGNREPAIAIPIKSATKKGYEVAHYGDSINLAFPDSKTRQGRVGKGKAQTLDTHCNQGVLVSGLYTNDSKDFARKPLREKSRTLKGHKHDAGIIIYNGQKCFIRKLTPLECWRLQAWDDESFFRAFFLDKGLAHRFNIAYQRHKNSPVKLMQWAYKHQKMSDSQLYKQAGNGVTVEVIRRIGEQLELK